MKKTFCVMPWINFSLYQNGIIRTCCINELYEGYNVAKNNINNKLSSLNMKKNTIKEIINSDTFKNIRLKMLNNKLPKACIRCFKDEEIGIPSRRIISNKNFNYNINNAIAETNGDGSIRTKFKSLELRFNTNCNLKCRICGPHFSKKWETEYNKLSKTFTFVMDLNYSQKSVIDKKHYWKKIFKHSNEIESIFLVGGELMLIKEHWDFLKFLIKNNYSKNIQLLYNLNMSFIPDYAFELWSNFKFIYLGLSIDALGKRCEYLRNGLKWKNVISNLEKIYKNKNKARINIVFHPSITWMSVYYYDEYNKFINDNNFQSLKYNCVYEPEYLSPWILPIEIKKDILKRCKNHIPHNKYILFKSIMLNNPSNPNLLKKGILFNKWLDKSRNENFAEIFPELYNKIKKYWK